jgi:Na+-driven multidrug efflux pump
MGGGVAVATYGVLLYVDGIIHPMLYGLCDSLQPAIGYNYGAKRFDRVMALAKRGFGASAVLSAVMTVFILLAGKWVVLIFVQAEDAAVITMTIHALSFFAFTYLTRWVSLASQIFMSAIGKVLYAVIISVAMAFVFPVLLLCLTGSLGLNALWLNMPLSALLTAILSVIMLAKFLKFNAQAKA